MNAEKKILALSEEIKRLNAENFKLKNIIDNLPGDIYWKNIDGTWSGVNKSGGQSLIRMGFIQSSVDVIGKTDYQLFTKETADLYRDNDRDVMEKKLEIAQEESNQLPSGETIIQLSIKKPLLDEDGVVVGVIGNTIDITYLKKIESDLRIAIEAAEAASRAKTEFIANMGHDIRTPLTGIIGMSHILEEELKLPEEKEHAEIIHASGEQLLGLLNGVLDLITVDAATEDTVLQESYDVRQVIDDILELERPAVIARQLGIESHIDESIP